MRCLSSLDGEPVYFTRPVTTRLRHPGTVEFSGPSSVNAESINIVSKSDLIIRLIETRVSRRSGGQIINRLII
jgi:hypothetical protein